jgi:hypothetical protein
LNGQDPAAIAAGGALKMAASVGGGTGAYGILRVSYGMTVSPKITLELNGEINLMFTAAVMLDDIKVDGLLKVADEALVCKIQVGGELGTVKLSGSGEVQFGAEEATPAADTGIDVQIVDEPENDLGGGYFDDEYDVEDDEEAFNDAIVASLTLKLDAGEGNLSELETGDDGKVLKLAVNGTAKLAADIVLASGETAPKVTWLSENESMVSVDDEGNIEVLNGGSVRIMASAGGKSDTCTVSSALGPGLYVGNDPMILESTTGNSMLEKAFNYIANDINNENGTAYTIVLDTNEEDSTSDGYTIGTGASGSKTVKTTKTKKNLTITIQGTNSEVTITKKATSKTVAILFTVYGNTTDDTPHLILENITLNGYSNNNDSLVVIGRGATNEKGILTMKSGSRITANINTYNLGGGVRIMNNCEFFMEGGSIDNNKTTDTTATYNKGGGVYFGGTQFTMTGGEIWGNKSNGQGAAVFVSATSTFSKTSGIIYGNNENEKSNTNTTSNDSNHVIDIGTSKWRNATAGEEIDLNSVGDSGYWGQ